MQVTKVKISWNCPWKEHFYSFIQHKISWNQDTFSKISWIWEISWQLASLKFIFNISVNSDFAWFASYAQFTVSHCCITPLYIIYPLSSIHTNSDFFPPCKCHSRTSHCIKSYTKRLCFKQEFHKCLHLNKTSVKTKIKLYIEKLKLFITKDFTIWHMH